LKIYVNIKEHRKGGGGIKENNGWSEFKYDIVNAMMYLQYNNKKY
jgi:hypothetical protein